MNRVWIHIGIFTIEPFGYFDPQTLTGLKNWTTKCASERDITIINLNGSHNQLHFLVNLSFGQTIEEVVSELKIICRVYLKYLGEPFEELQWNDFYIALSISSSLLEMESYCIEHRIFYHLNNEVEDQDTTTLDKERIG